MNKILLISLLTALTLSMASAEEECAKQGEINELSGVVSLICADPGLAAVEKSNAYKTRRESMILEMTRCSSS